MLRVGITGGIGSGKTLVCKMLEILGAPVYSADERARYLMNKDPELKDQISLLLGKEAYSEGNLDRAYIAGRVFDNEILLDKLNKLVHPVVGSDFEKWAGRQDSVPYLLKEAAILFESGAHRQVDLTVLVHAPEELRISRVVERDAADPEQVRLRMKQQMSEDERKKLADYIINNNGKEMLLPQVIDLHESILRKI